MAAVYLINPYHRRQVFIRISVPFDQTHLVVVRGLSNKKFHPSASTRRAQLSVAATTVRLTDLANCSVKTHVNTD